jgi:hypothetical protein
MYVVRSVACALWMIDAHHGTLSLSHAAGVPKLPEVWSRFSNYDNYKAKKQKKRQLSSKALNENAQVLVGMLSKPISRRRGWEKFQSDVEGLVSTMIKYSDMLSKAAKAQAARQSLHHIVRPLSEFSDLEIRASFDGTRALTKEETCLHHYLEDAGDWKPVEFQEDIFPNALTAMQRHRFLKSFKLPCTVAVYCFAVGGSKGTLVFMWKIPCDASQTDQVYKSTAIIDRLKETLPQYHTRQMKRNFKMQCEHLVAITPTVRRCLYSCLTADESAPHSQAERDIDFRMKLVALGDLPDLCADLRSLYSGRPTVYDAFLSAVEEVLTDYTAEDDRRHRTAHLIRFISQRDLHTQASARCPPEPAIPSPSWLAL